MALGVFVDWVATQKTMALDPSGLVQYWPLWLVAWAIFPRFCVGALFLMCTPHTLFAVVLLLVGLSWDIVLKILAWQRKKHYA
jgi:hypothetical protein